MSIYTDTIRHYLNLGFSPIPIKFKSKQPAIEGWNTFRIDDDDIENIFRRTNQYRNRDRKTL
jgi:hypothetical protein